MDNRQTSRRECGRSSSRSSHQGRNGEGRLRRSPCRPSRRRYGLHRHGPVLIAFDGHIDTVGIGNPDNWTFDPYEGFEDTHEIGGRGVSDQLGGTASAVYAAKIMKDLGLLNGKCRGQRGRMEIRVDVKGVSCHGSAPERGDNAIYKMADILQNVRALNNNGDSESTDIQELVKMLNSKFNTEWLEARFLGRGTITASEIFFTSPSRCAVADSCSVSLDQRMSVGETWESCLQEIRELPAVKKYGSDVTVSMYHYDRPSYTGLVYLIECYFPTWVLPEDHKVYRAAVAAYKDLFGEKRIGDEKTLAEREVRPLLDKWTFSTNGVSIMGRNGIPVIGFGPGAEAQAHAPEEIIHVGRVQ